MNALERKMVDILKDLRENHFVSGIKAEFEAEGTRLEEALRLKEVCMRAGLGLTIKIGGCEAIRDMYECRVIGVDRIVAPMVETAYALKKFLNAFNMVFSEIERDEVKSIVNVETIKGCEDFENMLKIPEIDILDGIVMGRVDLTGSLNMTREDINSEPVFKITEKLLVKAKTKSLETAIGGGVSAYSLPFFRRLPENTLDRYETRKVIFSCPGALNENADKGILKAVGFELMWLKNKRDFYGMIYTEDAQRIEMLEARYKKLIEEAGGKYE